MRKIQEWTITPTKPYIILGDSNLSRIQSHSRSNLQIDSYPGATFYHIAGLLEKTQQNSKVEKVLLSVGINNKDQHPKRTAIKQLQSMVRVTKSTFPAAEIWIPLINYSQNLEPQQKSNLEEINSHILRNMPHVPKLPEGDFRTTRDDIHWTERTADKMLGHWLQHLN